MFREQRWDSVLSRLNVADIGKDEVSVFTWDVGGLEKRLPEGIVVKEVRPSAPV
ncbi:hypothetical protein SAMN05216223_13263 [Actinacidiphila yanglinensis]|uniref:Uncharacterized protein n=1 Tax=Actinacidiphila yanglinensis TaxID=310779 RepID=A0A1H6EE14_9ACTN|nr:hypothetical protein [Actinacidiphila yanglinensis]SEG95206.1 hypothetical protein SAMN05216223_13263 [Actinacidiphila yanglinensis]